MEELREYTMQEHITTEDKLEFNAQGAVTFTLVGTNLIALYRKQGTDNVFLVKPTDAIPSEGMTIAQIVDDINSFLKDYDKEAVQLDSGEVAQAVQNVDEASRKSGTESAVCNLNYKDIRVQLKQAFLYLHTGNPIEYAFELNVNTKDLFPENQSFFKVDSLALSVWNTDRDSVLARMNIIDFDKYLNA